MTASKKNPIVPALLVLGIAGCAFLLPWGAWFGPDKEERLTERVAEYVQLRKDANWVKVYELMDERDRQKVPLARFLLLYGQSALDVNEITEKTRQWDENSGLAFMTLELDASLALDRLPANYRSTMAPTTEADRRKVQEFALKWSWRNGDWWLRMDDAAVTGKSADGRQISPTVK